MFNKYDVIVVGAGHAGCEAAHAAATMGSKVLLITMNMQTIAQMSCNPAMGGVAKGQIVREIDALGGMSGIITDKTMIQFRMLNRSKGPAMWSPRAQSDRMRFAEEWRLTLEKNPNVDFWQDMVTDLLINKETVTGVKTSMGLEILSNTVILTNGTFLNGIIHIGDKQFGGGRTGERAATGLTKTLENLGFQSGRMKTGTPPRVDGRSIDYTKCEEQKGDDQPGQFSYWEDSPLANQRSCHITYTNPMVHEILETGFDRSPMFNGRIRGVGPRYCPSIEDKINRFSERERHQIFIEPEGWNTVEVYVNGFSTSLPEEIQYRALQHIPGFEKVKMFRPGYAIEYDYFPPTQLDLSLQTKLVKNLFFAGQINGTTGYEEAACQGLMAGINAHQSSQHQECLIIERSQGYIGVLIDDLINKGTEEPYRMFTSRAEYRILLRQDNADQRLTPLGISLNLINKKKAQRYHQKIANLDRLIKQNNTTFLDYHFNDYLQSIKQAPLKNKTSVASLLKRPHININQLQESDFQVFNYLSDYPDELLTLAEIQIKYEDYIKRESENVKKIQSLEHLLLRGKINYDDIPALSNEARSKLKMSNPETLGQASRISGISPADISILSVYLGR
jgi:tRNA uridine 5-carboxymethylaminomethyl modification enzyme